MHRGDNTELSMYSYEHPGTHLYDKFLLLLNKVDLVTFHVSSMLLSPTWDRDQIERKRVVGNDHILIIFKEYLDSCIDLTTITSNQIHVVFIVSMINDQPTMTAFKKPCVPNFQYTQNIADPKNLLQSCKNLIFICIVMSAERAVCKSPKIEGMLVRKRNFELWELVKLQLLNI